MDRDELEREHAHLVERYAAIEHRAEEEHIAYIVRETAAVWERHAEIKHGRPETHLVLEVTIEGEYPQTRIRIRVFDRSQDKALTLGYPVWDEGWLNPDGSRWSQRKIAGDMLMMARGG
ncbi:MAG: hypothetical protein ABI726_07470 [bacterium]